MDLFDSAADDRIRTSGPLASRMRPRTLDEIAGHEDLLGSGRPLRSLIENDALASLILWGPAGSGKTTIARVIAAMTARDYVALSAVETGVKEVRSTIAAARERLGRHGRGTTLFLDEIHRFNKAQQDAFLPAVENGTIVLVGATTENPFFEINTPLLSRAMLFRLEMLADEDVSGLLDRAVSDPRGLAGSLTLADDACVYLASKANGDARRALTGLEVAAALAKGRGAGVIELADAENAVDSRMIAYDKGGDVHYDVISAFIKSLRGSDPQAAVYWLGRMIRAGDDPRFIARRMVILASEDVGLADPQALVVAVAAAQALDFVGLPEAEFNLTEAALYLARAPKSNSVYVAMNRAGADLEHERIEPVPAHLRDASYRGARRLGHGEGYVYPHDEPGHYVDQEYLPEHLSGRIYYEPSGEGEDG